MLRDRLVGGIAHPQWQRHLLAEEGLTFDKAVKLLQSMESAEQEVKGLSGQPSKQPQQVNRIQHGKPSGKPSPGKQPLHESRVSPAITVDQIIKPMKEAICHYCHKKGHIAFVCRKKAK